MYVHFDQWFGLAASGAGFGDAEAVDFDEPDGNRLTLGQLVEQPVDADLCAPTTSSWLPSLCWSCNSSAACAIGLAQAIHPAIARDGGKPRQEGTFRVITGALLVQRNQRILHQVVHRVGGNLLRKETRASQRPVCSRSTA